MKQPQPGLASITAMRTHVSSAPTLMAATNVGVQQRASSLQQLEKDKNLVGRRYDSHLKQVPVIMVFLIAPYEKTTFGDFSTKKFKKIVPAGTTGEVSLLLGEAHATERDLLAWLFKQLRVSEDHTGGKPPCVDDWRLCTTANRGTTAKPGSWQAMSWRPDVPLSLHDYKDAVHHSDGKDKDTTRAGFMPTGTVRGARRVLGVFAVTEVLLNEVVARQYEPPTRPSLSFEPYGHDDSDDMFVTQPSPPARQPRARPAVSSRRLPPLLTSQMSRSADTTSVPSRINFSPLPSAGTGEARPSTAASSVVELSSCALSGLAMARFMGVGGHGVHGPVTPPGREVSQDTAADVGDLTVCPANLTVQGPGDANDGDELAAAALTLGEGFVDAAELDVIDDPEAYRVVGRKRKVPSPAQSEANGKPKQPRLKRARRQTAKAQEESGNTRARQSVRVMARSALG